MLRPAQQKTLCIARHLRVKAGAIMSKHSPLPQPGSAQRASSVPQVGVIYNPRSHRNKGQDLDSDPAPHVFISQPGDHDQLPIALQRFAERGIDLLVINGGDGTVRDVLTCGYAVFGENWPAIAVLPKGKTNALTVDLDAPKEWSLQGAIDAYQNGRRIERQPMVVKSLDSDAMPQLGFIMGAGVFTLSIRAGQDAHRLGAFNALAVGVTTVWSLFQALLGSRSNRWRRGAPIEIALGEKRAPMPHSGHGESSWRQLLFASTLERFPAGIKPFGSLKRGLKMAVLDQTSRTNLLQIPLILFGKSAEHAQKRGMHQLRTTRFEAQFGDAFILDGEAYPAGHYAIEQGPTLEFVTP